MERYQMTDLNIIHQTKIYKINSCGIKDNLQEILQKIDNREKALLLYINIVFNFFNIYIA